MKYLYYPLLSIVVLGLSACSSTSIKNKSDFYSNPKYLQHLDDADFMPTKLMLKRKALKGAIVEPVIHSNLKGTSLIAPVINAKISQLLLDAGVEVIDRNAGEIIKHELEAYESTGRSTGLVVDVADVVLAPVIVSATHEAKYTPPYYSVKDDKRRYNSAQCEHKTEISGYIKVYNMPSMKQRKQIELEHNITYNLKTRNRNCEISETMLNDFVITTTKAAIRLKENDIRNEFSPRGYVLEHRKTEDKHYIKINQGSDLGIVQNIDIQFIRTIENKDNLSGEVTRNEFIMGSGEVTDFIYKNSAWVEVDESLASKIKRGGSVQVLFKTGYLY
ncbi:MAG: hypothetical protein ACJAXJ_003553 [Colwellia sp.]|jgi:hypothetical protein